ncbi:MAG: SGNH/GDSL hydrolase family protein [Actinobacteria bacterium]|nr:SGNH/GDSL hydrolase family protein [Actinomycetota bacterium]MBU1942316.1 SGNH/GDSL hydrolase family protein [Actinomycetota bacterium]MBU2686872.1 SGNH/GDSL hydrolase family protein [Actinomycetota bacterium]
MKQPKRVNEFVGRVGLRVNRWINRHPRLATALRGAALRVSILQGFFRSRVLRRPVVHVIGDSHAKVFKGEEPFVVHRLGRATAYNLRKEKSTTKSRERLMKTVRYVDGERDSIVMVFGEIDCRIHIYDKHMESGGERSVEDLIDATVSSYGEVLETLSGMGFDLYVHGVPAPVRAGNENLFDSRYYAAPGVRSYIYREFNERLKEHCRAHGYPYIDIYSRIADAEGFMKPEYVADRIHPNKKVLEFVRPQIHGSR